MTPRLPHGIRSKILAAILAAVGVMALLGAFILYSNLQMLRRFDRQSDGIIAEYRLAAETERLVELYNSCILNPQDPTHRDQFRQGSDRIDALLARLDAYDRDAVPESSYAGLKSSVLHMRDRCREGLAALDGRDMALTERIYLELLRKQPYVVDNSARLIVQEVKQAAARQAQTQRANQLKLLLLALLLAAAVSACFAYGFSVANALTLPLAKLTAIVRTIAAGNMDAHVDPQLLARRDETGSLSRGFDRMLAHLRKTLDDLNAEVAVRKRAEALADQANRSKSAFLANMSHEIRTPMNGVIGMAELLLVSKLTKDQRHLAEIVHTSAESLLALLNDILDYSKIEAGKLRLDHLDFSLRNTVDSVAGLLAVRARQKGISLACSVAPDVPARLRGDPARLRQILNNLVGNAIKFTENGGVSISVERLPPLPSAAVDAPLLVRFSVKDTGIGIPEDKQNLLFSSFSQVDDSITRQYGGSGLGLAISKQLAELMGGSIGFQSAVGLGSIFWVAIPFAPPQESLPESPAPPPPPLRLPSPDPHPGRLPAILVAEDNSINQQVALSLLAKMELSADVVPNGRQALDALAAKPYDLVFMDVQMPVMDGLEATQLIRESEKQGDRRVPIVAMTAYSMAGDRERCLSAGMDDHLPKPLTSNALLAVLERWLPGKAKWPAPETHSPSPPHPGHPGEAPILNLADVTRRLMGDEQLAMQICTSVVEELPRQIEDLRKLAAAGDAHAAERQAHTIQGAALNIGAAHFRAIARQMEIAARKGNLDLLKGLLPSLDEQLARLQDAFRRLRA